MAAPDVLHPALTRRVGDRPAVPVTSKVTQVYSGVCLSLQRFARAAFALGALLFVPVQAHADPADSEVDDNRKAAVNRVADVHDLSMIVGTGNLVLKQAGIRAARNLLTIWGREAGLNKTWKEGLPEWDAAEAVLLAGTDGITGKRFSGGFQVRNIWSEITANNMDSEEADVVANHFESEAGREQLSMMDWFLSETVLFTYTYSERFKYDLKGAEKEQKDLQNIMQPKIPKKDNEVDFSTRNPEAFRFVACSPQSPYCPGVKYAKILAGKVVGGIVTYIDGIIGEIETSVRGRRPLVQPTIDAYARKIAPPPPTPVSAPQASVPPAVTEPARQMTPSPAMLRSESPNGGTAGGLRLARPGAH